MRESRRSQEKFAHQFSGRELKEVGKKTRNEMKWKENGINWLERNITRNKVQTKTMRYGQKMHDIKPEKMKANGWNCIRRAECETDKREQSFQHEKRTRKNNNHLYSWIKSTTKHEQHHMNKKNLNVYLNKIICEMCHRSWSLFRRAK